MTEPNENSEPLADGIVGIDGTLYKIKFQAIHVAEKNAEKNDGGADTYQWSNIRYLTVDEDNELGRGFGKADLTRLRESIREEGLFYPLICRWISRDGNRTVQLVDGERRFRNIDFLIRKNERCKDPSTGKYVPAKELYEYILCQVYDAPTDKDALKLAYKSGTCRVDFGDEADVSLVKDLREKKWSDEEILDVTGNRPEWLRDMDRLLEKLADDEPTLTAFFKGQINKAAALAFAEVEDIEVRHAGLEQAMEYATEDAKKKVAKLEKSILRLRENEEIAKAQQVEATHTGDTTGNEDAEADQKAAQKKAQDKLQQKAGVKPVVKARHARAGLSGANADPAATVQSLRAPKIKKYYLEPLETAIKNKGNDEEDNFLAPVELLRGFREIVKGILEGEMDPLKIFRKYGKKLRDIEEK